MLMHVNPQEVAGLSALLGSEPTINPDTGMPEAFNWLSPILGVLGGTASMFMGSAVGEPLEEAMKGGMFEDWAEPLSTVGSGLAGAATNAGISALGAGLSGGNVGNEALAGALTGGAMGAYGNWEADNLLGKPPVQPAQNPSLATDASMGYGQMGMDTSDVTSQSPGFFDQVGTNLGRAWDTNTKNGGFKNFIKTQGEPLMLAGAAQAGLSSEFGVDEQKKKIEEQQLRLLQQAGIDPADLMYSYSFSTPGSRFAGGGIVGQSAEFGVPTQVILPQRYIDEVKNAGGLEALMLSDPQNTKLAEQLMGAMSYRGAAQGGYINTKPFNPQEHYPQSMIDKAKPYAAAAPQRHEVVDGYEDGGFVEGEGDGMSDDVDALLEGEEEIRVADGEVIIPKAIVDMFGVEALDNMLKRVRMAAYGTDKQVKQDAGKEVVLDMLD
jgi:hypothetical protein